MLVVFLLDTSGSMNQQCANGLSLLDCAKSAVEHFHKVRSRDAASRLDRYMLVTCDDASDCIKVVDKYPFTHFMRALKSVQARDLTNIGGALQRIFSFLHVQRLAHDIDRYGQGRNPCVNDLTTILLVTDGTELTSLAGVSQSLQLNGPAPLGADLAVQLYRWDQRVFATVLRIPSVSTAVLERSGPIPQNAPISGAQSAVAMDANISHFCESTGGKCFVATNLKILMQHIEVTASRLPPCVIVSFDHMSQQGSALPPQVHLACQRKMLLVRGGQAQGQGHWPIPEAYWPDPSHLGVHPREAHPVIAYKPMDADPYIPSNFVFDKYEIESNPITGFLLKAVTGACWQVYIRNSKGPNHNYGDPFGFLRLNRGGSNLTLFVLPYNYPVLWHLLDQLVKMPGAAKMAPPLQWRQDVERYCNNIPAYYVLPLRQALKRWGLNAHVVPDSMENSLLAGFVGTQLKKLKAEARVIFDADMSRIMTEQQSLGISGNAHRSSGRTLPQLGPTSTEAPPGFKTTGNVSFQPRGIGHSEQATSRKMGWEMLLPSGPSPPHAPPPNAAAAAPFAPPSLGMMGPEVAATPSLSGGIMKDVLLFKNPFDVPRDQLLRQLQYLPIRVALAADARHQNQRSDRVGGKTLNSSISNLAARLAAKEEEEARHSLPIEKMGDFNEALLKQQPPRNPFAEEPDRSKQQRTMFGNPYRQEKSDGSADEAWLEGTSPLLRGRKRRRRLPLDSAASVTSLSSSASDSTVEVSSTEVTSPPKPGLDIGTTTDGKSPDTLLPPLTDHKLGDQRNFVKGTESVEEKSDPKYLKSGLGAERPNDLSEKGIITVNNTVEEATEAVPTNNIENTMIVEHSGQQRRILVVTPLGSHQEQSQVVAFLLSVIKALKYSKPSNTKKLFELLSVPDFPVDKSNFLEQLIIQAQRYNKVAVAKELVEYREKLSTHQPEINPQ
ncbi:hypothetical protein CY35_10G033700 [Sphagnum magellanicum]|nr:hypothetical protein CY35_10G033700 [Sphagnum magellanicum]